MSTVAQHPEQVPVRRDDTGDGTIDAPGSRKVSKQALRRSWFSWYTGNLSSMSFEWLESFGFAQSMAPVIRELYPDKEDQVAALQRHSAFYNTEPQLGSIVNGIAIGMEEERANGADVGDEVINSIKVGLMGPLAGIGDAIIPGMYIPLLLSIGIGLAGSNGSVLGPLFYIVTFLTTITALSYFVFMKGYQLGTRSIDLIVGEAAQRVRQSFNLLGGIVVGGVAASFVALTTKLVIPTGGDKPVAVQAVLDGIFPKLLPLGVVLLAWWLMSKRRLSAIKVMLILVAIALVGVLLNVF